MWNFIKSTMTDRSVILTTHSMVRISICYILRTFMLCVRSKSGLIFRRTMVTSLFFLLKACKTASSFLPCSYGTERAFNIEMVCSNQLQTHVCLIFAYLRRSARRCVRASVSWWPATFDASEHRNTSRTNSHRFD